MLMTFRLTILLGFLLFESCHDNSLSNYSEDKWFSSIRDKILADSEQKADSVTTGNSKAPLLTESYYLKGVHLMDRFYSSTSKSYVGETRYSADKRFELRRELYPSGQLGFEGIFYGGNFYGLSTWWFENGQISERGIRFNGQKISIWKTWDEQGNLLSEKDYNNTTLIDSLTLIKY